MSREEVTDLETLLKFCASEFSLNLGTMAYYYSRILISEIVRDVNLFRFVRHFAIGWSGSVKSQAKRCEWVRSVKVTVNPRRKPRTTGSLHHAISGTVFRSGVG